MLAVLPLLFLQPEASAACATEDKTGMVIGAYVYRSEMGIPDPTLVTHVNFAFAHVNETFDGVFIPDKRELRKVARLGRKRGAHCGRCASLQARPGNALP